LWNSYTEEQLKEFEDQIPEWKKGALENLKNPQLSTEQITKRNAVLSRISDYFSSLVENDEEYEKMMEEMDQMKTSLKEIRHNVSDKIKSSDSEVVKKGYEIYETKIQNMGSKLMSDIRKWDPDFDLLDFEKEAQLIFEQVYGKYLEHDIDYLEGVCSSSALGFFKSKITYHLSLEAEPKFKNFLYMKSFSLSSSTIEPESGTPMFRFMVDVAQIDCLVSKYNIDDIVFGYENNIEHVKIDFVLVPWKDADIGIIFR
jgi:hypothetical protein